jgi:putative oxidoreductase
MDTNAVNLALLGLRVTAGVVMFAHGWNHLARMREGPGVSNWFASLGLHPGPAHAWLVTVTELAAGPALVFGLLTPLGAAAVTGVAAVAWVTNHRNAGFFVFKRPTEGWEYVMVLTVLGLALGALGPGEWSLDNALGFSWVDGWSGLATTAIAGLGGALALLVFFWRPPREEAAG